MGRIKTKHFAAAGAAETANDRKHDPAAGSGNAPGRKLGRQRRSISGGAGQGEGFPRPESPAGYETARPAHLDSANHFEVVTVNFQGVEMVRVLRPSAQPMSRTEAVNLMVWLGVNADPGLELFDRMFGDVVGTARRKR